MALPPQKFREIVVQLLYSQDFSVLNKEESILLMMHELKVTKRTMVEVFVKIDAVLSKLPEIDARIASISTEYSFDRITKVDLAVLRLGAYELLHEPSLPPKVAIAESIRLSRKFGTPESANFVNAILDNIYKNEHTPKSSKEPVTV